MTSLVKDLLARVGTAEAAFVTACQERDAAELALAEERKGRALLARATDRINELESEIARMRTAIFSTLYNDGHMANCTAPTLHDDRQCHAVCRRLRSALPGDRNRNAGRADKRKCMNRVTNAERSAILARAMETVTLDSKSMAESYNLRVAELMREFGISRDRARFAVAKAARVKRGQARKARQ